MKLMISVLAIVVASALGGSAGRADPYAAGRQSQRVAAAGGAFGGGFIELLMTGRDPGPAVMYNRPTTRRLAAHHAPSGDPFNHPSADDPHAHAFAHHGGPLERAVPARFMRQTVRYAGSQSPGSIVIDTAGKYLYLVQAGGKAIRYGIGVGREGFTWRGTQTISQKREWPDWRPPAEMLRRRPDLPRYMAGGTDNPLGARALYLGATLYRIHGTNEPHTIGQNVSSGCIRMLNEDVMDLYGRVGIGTRVIVS